jgi:GT2 family glycosyltransferase
LDYSTVSIIIPTKNSEHTLKHCLNTIKNQNYHEKEMIIVDCFSNDNTVNIASLFNAKTIQTSAGRSEARNRGAQEAKGDLLLFLDSDMLLDSMVVSECIKKIGEGYEALIIPEISVGQGFWANCKKLEKLCYVNDEMVEAARFFKKEVFVNVGGYDTCLEAGEDWDIHERVKLQNCKVGRINSFIIHQEGKLSIASTMRKKYQYGQTLSLYRRKQPNRAKHQIGLSRLSLLKSPRLTKDPVHASGLIILKTCEALAFLTGFLKAKTRRGST